jgi:hypothetical protein
LTWGTLASLTAIPTYYALKDEYKDICIEIAFFVFCISYYATAFNITRQFVAVSFVFWGIKYVYKNKLIPFLATVLVATGFHTSALIAVLIWFMWDHKQSCAIKGTKRFGVIIAITIAVIYYQEIITFFASSVSIFESYDGYAETSLRGKNRDLYVSILECVITYIIGYQMLQEDEKLDFMFSLLLIATLIGFTGFRHPQVKRIAYYFYMPSRLVLCGYLPYCFAENSILLSKILICSFYVVLFVLTAFILAEGNLVPYHFDLFSAW